MDGNFASNTFNRNAQMNVSQLARVYADSLESMSASGAKINRRFSCSVSKKVRPVNERLFMA